METLHRFDPCIRRMSWTEKEKKDFKEWDRKRKNGELGVPLVFNSVKELRKWLDSQK